VARAGPAVAALFANLTPLFTALIAGLVLSSWPEWYHALAFVLIVAGIASSALRPAQGVAPGNAASR
jgi:drug/metabolite transporter (DMT)-like permease